MAGFIYEWFGYALEDTSEAALSVANSQHCPFLRQVCTKQLKDGKIAGVCSIQTLQGQRVICCPIRLYAQDYEILRLLTSAVFGGDFPIMAGSAARCFAVSHQQKCVAVFGQGWGGEIRIPGKSSRSHYSVDWVLALISETGELIEFVAVEVQTIDTTGNYHRSLAAALADRSRVKSSVGLNWANVTKRIIPQLIQKGQILQREEKCQKGLFFVCPSLVLAKIFERLGGVEALPDHPLQKASITFVAYDFDEVGAIPGEPHPLRIQRTHSTTGTKLSEAFNRVNLTEKGVYEIAIEKALDG